MITIPGKIPITIHPLFWLVALFIGLLSTKTFLGAFVVVLVILISVLVHEFGHALTGMLFGQSTRIQLAAFGGFTYREGRKLKLWEEFIVVLNGPLAGLALFILARYLTLHFTFTNSAIDLMVKFAAIVNFFWTIINLIPVLPLDGGHLMSILLEALFGFRGVKMAVVLGLAISVAVSVYFFVVGQFFVGALFLILTFESFRSLRYFKVLTEKDRDSDLQAMARSASEDFQAKRFDEALSKLKTIRDKTKHGILYNLATEEMADIYRHQNRLKEGFEALLPIKDHLSSDSLILFHYLAYENEEWERVIECANPCYQNSPKYETALINAAAFAAIGKVEPAIGWLECALREGGKNMEEFLKKRAFDPIRNSSQFQAFATSLKKH